MNIKNETTLSLLRYWIWCDESIYDLYDIQIELNSRKVKFLDLYNDVDNLIVEFSKKYE